MELMGWDARPDPRVARLIDANLDRAREGLRVVEDWCRFGLERRDLVTELKDWRQRLGRLHREVYKQARSTAGDTGAGMTHPAQSERCSPRQVVAANCARVQEALRVLEEYGRNIDPLLASESAAIRYSLYDLEVSCLSASAGLALRDQLQSCKLCLITTETDQLLQLVETSLNSGVDMVQYRSKKGHDRLRLQQALALKALCRKAGALFIVNDRVDLALAADADGVHLGQDDLPTEIARSQIGPTKLLGRSTHCLEEISAAHNESCDYLGLGPAFSTATKPDRHPIGLELIREAVQQCRLPLFAIGGINNTNLAKLMEAGCSRIAVIGAIMNATDPGAATSDLLSTLSRERSD